MTVIKLNFSKHKNNVLELINDEHIEEIHLVLTSRAGAEVELMTMTSELGDALSLSSAAKFFSPDLLNSAPSNCCSAFRVIGGCNVGASVVWSFTTRATNAEEDEHLMRITIKAMYVLHI